jgi:uncharacterized protein YqgV (UPF0045/DUF77 family)
MAIDVNNIVQFYQGTALPSDAVNHPNRVYFIKSGEIGSLYKGNVLIAQTNNDATIKTIESNIENLGKELDDHVVLYNALVKLVQDNGTAIEANQTAIAGIKNGAGINDFAAVETALAGKQAAGDYATKTEAKGYADAKDEAIAAAKKAGDDAQGAADKAQQDVDNLTEYVGTIPTTSASTSIVQYIQEKTSDIASDQALEELTGRVAENERDISVLEGKLEDVTGKVGAQITAAVEAEKGRAENVEAGLRTDVNLKAAQADLEAEISRATLAEAGLNTRLEEVETFFELAEGEKLDEALDTLVEIQEYITNEGAAADQMVLDIAANAEAIKNMDAAYKAADEAMQKEIDAAEAAIATKAAAADLTALAGRVTAEEGKVATLQTEMDAVEAKAEQNKTDIATANAEIAKKANQVDLTALTGRVSTAEGKIENLQADLDTATTGVKARLTAVENKASENATAIGNNASDISALLAALEWHQA